MHVKVFGFLGRKGSGKDTASECLRKRVEAQGEIFLTFSLADPLKEICQSLVERTFGCSISREYFYDPSLKDVPVQGVDPLPLWNGRTLVPRKMMQELGTDILRYHLGDDVWVDALIRKIENALSGLPEDASVVISIPDIRFPSEVERLSKWRPLTLVKIIRGVRLDEHSGHSSETLSENIQPDILIMNSGTIEQLSNNVNSIL